MTNLQTHAQTQTLTQIHKHTHSVTHTHTHTNTQVNDMFTRASTAAQWQWNAAVDHDRWPPYLLSTMYMGNSNSTSTTTAGEVMPKLQYKKSRLQ